MVREAAFLLSQSVDKCREGGDSMARGTKTGGGSRKGKPNKTTAQVKEAIQLVYREMGGDEAFLIWARANPDIFYEKIFIKLLPNEIKASVDLNVTPAAVLEEVRKRRERSG